MEKVALPPPPNKRLIKTALHQAVLDIRLHQVRLLVSRHGVNVDCRDMHGRTPLMLACMIDNEEHGFKMASIFLKAGAYLNVRDSMGRTALSYACLNGRQDIVRSILKEDVLDINEPDNDGNTPIHHAAMSGNPNIVRMLADTFHKFGLNPDKRNKLGYTPLLLACKCGNYVSAYTLLTVTRASPTLRDGEFHLNATEWIQRTHQIQVNVLERGLLSSAPASIPPSHTLSFSREYTMYQLPPTSSRLSARQPHHPHPLSFSLDSGSVHLPPVFKQTKEEDRSEVFINGHEARQVLLDHINDVESKQRPLSIKTFHSRFSHPPTAKLLSLSRRSHTGVPHDVLTLFRLYSDQYQPDWRGSRRDLGGSRPSLAGGQGVSVSSDVDRVAGEVVCG
ncbi:uncharacterized protein LOC143294876 [Babylonia areolata]|uniref:uncharacterized protein LOC143294876 n=1 Tax=Babylonia areolata TaxID=304850 RepID=UPI003FD4BC9F